MADPTNPSAEPALHPGTYIRETCLAPRELSVSAAAKLVGVGRPALSNFLNGKAAVTPEMAMRIEVAFGIEKEKLLAMQSAFDAAGATAKGAPSEAMPYAAPFLQIKARDIEAWARRNVGARSRFAVFLRTLVNSTGRGLTKVDFPGNDDAERPGWDGLVEATQGTPWIPEGDSGWEFGMTADPKAKADSDIAKSVAALTKEECKARTFVFVTPHHWSGKGTWATAQAKKNIWKAVRAYDSSDLEQWLEHSISAQAWFCHEEGKPSRGVKTLQQCWSDWAEVCDPPLPAELFHAAIAASKKTLEARLKVAPDTPIVVTADSSEEALAFIAQFFISSEEPAITALRDRVLVFSERGVATELVKGTASFVAVATSRDVEQELAAHMRTHHSIIVLPRNTANVEPDVVLEPLSYEAFRSPLEASGRSRDEVSRLENESGRSLTVLRRRVALAPRIRTPLWASDRDLSAALVPYMLIGAWNHGNQDDQAVLCLQAGEDQYQTLEVRCQQLVLLEDAPLWSVGSYRGVCSKLDLLFAVAAVVTASELRRFFDIAEIVLGEDDPALDLPIDKQWAAAIYGKVRQFSGALRQSVAETLVLLSVHGNRLFLERLGFDCEQEAEMLVRGLLTPIKTRLLEANDSDLAAYAEAAPEEFLRIIETDLKSEKPAVFGLMRPVGGDLFGSRCPRAGFLWALEGLAWNRRTMPRVVRVLAKLSEIEIADNWTNRPINSLSSIFSSWMPQTAASLEDRIEVLRQLSRSLPAIAWKVCMDQLQPGSRIGHYSHKPKWRNDGYGYGEPVPTVGPIHEWMRLVVDMVLDWRSEYSANQVSDLVNALPALAPEHREQVWKLIEAWAKNANDSDKAVIREQVRKRVLSRRGKRGVSGDDLVQLTSAAKRARENLEPSDIIHRYEWLFRNPWVDESADDLEENELANFEARDERIAVARANALKEVLTERGPRGIVDLACRGNASFIVGHLFSERVAEAATIEETVIVALRDGNADEAPRQGLVAGLISGCAIADRQNEMLNVLKGHLSEAEYLKVLLAAPFRRTTWDRVKQLGRETKRSYWERVSPRWLRDAEDEITEAMTELMLTRRPRAAFSLAQLSFERVDPVLLFRLMNAIATASDEANGEYRLDRYYVEDAFERINAGTGISIEEKASLEYMYLDVLAKPRSTGGRYGIPNLEKHIAAHPELYVQAIVQAYKRRDDQPDPPEYTAPSEQIAHLAERASRLLDALESVPGRSEAGEIDAGRLIDWIQAVRRACKELGRIAVADINIGQMLANAPLGTDGVWPCEAVRNVMEELHSEEIMRGARTGLFNARGVHFRGEGGDEERKLADKYRAWAEAVQFTHPYLSSELLMGMVRTYEADARREDVAASVRRRIR